MSLEDILKKEKPDPNNRQSSEQASLKSALEQELESEDTELAKELQRTRAEEIIYRRRVAMGMRVGVPDTSSGNVKAKEREEWLVDMAERLLNRGMDQRIVGDLIDTVLGKDRAPVVGLPGAPAPAQGMTFTDMMAFYKLVQESNKSDPIITNILEKLTDKVEALEKSAQAPPPAPAQRGFVVIQPDGSFQEVEPGKPVIVKIPPPAATGESIESLREKNRHDEKERELDIEKEHKEGLRGILQSVPTTLADGIAAVVESKSGTGAPAASSGAAVARKEPPMQDFECEDCHTKVKIPVGTKSFKCLGCGVVYNEIV